MWTALTTPWVCVAFRGHTSWLAVSTSNGIITRVIPHTHIAVMVSIKLSPPPARSTIIKHPPIDDFAHHLNLPRSHGRHLKHTGQTATTMIDKGGQRIDKMVAVDRRSVSGDSNIVVIQLNLLKLEYFVLLFLL
mmetsp:Transcript_9786/g.21163  ORF Transcript_9786/g.21163 Transcript_9786/m.21163 type:complete len:134 (+) Transcript_9786:206-607(+)